MEEKIVSEYSNDIHQLVVSVSKHWYIKKDGRLAYQKKPLTAKLNQVNTTKNHLVHYLMRDHHSGLFYGEVSGIHKLLPIADFLYRAWSKTENHIFHGFPTAITLPKNVSDVFPPILNLLKSYQVEILDVKSGFHAGVRDIRTWEEYIYQTCWSPSPEKCSTFETIEKIAPKLSYYICSDSIGRKPKIEVWKDSLEKLFVPSSYEEFIQAYCEQ